MKKHILASAFLLSDTLFAMAQNPIVPTGTYMADPSAHQWKDGKVYVYGSRDEKPNHYCSAHYDVLSSEDIVHWTVHKNTFSSVSPNDEVSYSDKALYAPDCIEKDGKFYLFYCLEGGGADEGTAIATSPIDPFQGGRIVEGAKQIDPSVFMDDDGQAYMTWGQFQCKMAKLKPNLREIDTTIIHTDVLTEEEHHFHEGSQLIKRNGIYYLIFADISRRGRPTSLGYATATSPFGPYVYRGVIIDNFGCDPKVWNNHGSLAEINDQWYIFYHRSTNASTAMRKACAEPIFFDEDGCIREVEMTTQGTASPLDPFVEMEAERACGLTGNVRVCGEPGGDELLDGIRNGDTAAYKYFRFDRRAKRLVVSVRPYEGGILQVYAGDLSGRMLCQFEVPASDGKQALQLKQKISQRLSGVCPLRFRFIGKDGAENLFAFESFRFE